MIPDENFNTAFFTVFFTLALEVLSVMRSSDIVTAPLGKDPTPELGLRSQVGHLEVRDELDPVGGRLGGDQVERGRRLAG